MQKRAISREVFVVIANFRWTGQVRSTSGQECVSCVLVLSIRGQASLAWCELSAVKGAAHTGRHARVDSSDRYCSDGAGRCYPLSGAKLLLDCILVRLALDPTVPLQFGAITLPIATLASSQLLSLVGATGCSVCDFQTEVQELTAQLVSATSDKAS